MTKNHSSGQVRCALPVTMIIYYGQSKALMAFPIDVARKPIVLEVEVKQLATKFTDSSASKINEAANLTSSDDWL